MEFFRVPVFFLSAMRAFRDALSRAGCGGEQIESRLDMEWFARSFALFRWWERETRVRVSHKGKQRGRNACVVSAVDTTEALDDEMCETACSFVES